MAYPPAAAVSARRSQRARVERDEVSGRPCSIRVRDSPPPALLQGANAALQSARRRRGGWKSRMDFALSATQSRGAVPVRWIHSSSHRLWIFLKILAGDLAPVRKRLQIAR
jgi:hypothetical protein